VVEEPAEDSEQAETPATGNKPGRPAAGAGKKPVKAAPLPDDDEDDDDRPRKKRRRADEDDEDDEDGEAWSYKNSWIRYAILGVLIIVMCVLGYMLYDKKSREAKDASRGIAPTELRMG
jgi:hypothetical protein